jgi:hypothetical protein
MKKRINQHLLFAIVLLVAASTAHAQLGSGWSQYSPTKKIHLDNEDGLQIYNWTASKSVCSPVCADYNYSSSNNTETFRILDNRSNRSEIRLQNDYSTGSRQFEGYVTFYAPLNDESLFQIFGSTSGATQLMIRGYSASGGSIRGGGVTLATGVYGKEVRINVIHLQENAGNKIIIYINGAKKAEIADNEAVSNYHKYGNYGTLTTDEAVVKWRNVKSFRNGAAPGSSLVAVSGDPKSANTEISNVGIFPNPVVDGQATIRYTVSKAAPVRIAIYNISGQEELITNTFQTAGNYAIRWNAANKPKGIYIARFRIGDKTNSERFVVE